MAPTLSTHGHAYVARRARDGAIKIGVTDKWPGYRCKELQYQHKSAVALLGMLRGGRQCEAALHRRFAADAIPGEREWFYPSESLREFIGRLPRPSATWPEWCSEEKPALSLEEIDALVPESELDAYIALGAA